MLLALDIGNTNIVAAIYHGDHLVTQWRMATDRRKTKDEYRILVIQALENSGLKKDAIEHVAISSVVPPLNPMLLSMFQEYWGIRPLIVRPGTKTGLNIKLDDSRSVGPDRIVNAVAAYHHYGGPVIIVDLGTATTFCAVNRHGDYLGGVICPGLGISTEALVAQTAKLPRIEICQPQRALGQTTEESMQSGVYFGYVGMVDGLISRFKGELGEEGQQAQVVITGGFGELIGKGCRQVDHIHPSLTLDGLRLLYERNRGER
ncbi:type III pantothenate kinase [Heliophilum fasciatum]|uniref:Type III pantothenate kinase n=1 Tax=Heliophilum fasciatum TaxID=35700 RepID=A0A4R2RW65_9FIRM|nr:type III pantothenate kinase [Heliophilum fasciatum]MCW2277383.1 type III pantothenate kinase [Heliophilum fasciatum]TCP67219.1 pantothenate kinase [Heliophilum fasciatum]